MTDYKDTLNLPKTAFPMKANLAQREPTLNQHWSDIGLYQKLREKYQGAPKFILQDGPPYANGNIHLGHALNKILKDFIVKSKSLSGFNAPFVPGWDCHGLPIELNVEKKMGKVGQKISPEAFRKACRDYAMTQVNNQRDAFKRLGITADWDNPYLTMDYPFEADTVRALGEIIQNGHLMQGVKPVHWCVLCGSALAEAEVEHQDKTSDAIDVLFNIAGKEKIEELLNITSTQAIFIPIWTTTPWTLPANQAVALHGELNYVCVQLKDKTLILAEALLQTCLARYGTEEYKLLTTFQGKQLEGVLLRHPFYDKHVPIVLGEHVTTEAGTGAVHTAPGHGDDDYRVGLQYQLSTKSTVNDKGCFHNNIPLFNGEHVYKVNPLVIETLKQKGTLLHAETLSHSYPHCWRHKTPLIFRTTPQWFISMDQSGLRQMALNAIKQVTWHPSWGEQRIANMIEGRPDWCISRQRTWGVPIPLFVHQKTGTLHPDTPELIEKVAKLIEKKGVEAWFSLSPETLLGKHAADYQKVTDTLDVWFDAGVGHEAVVAKREALQAKINVCLEGSDQYRGWFQSSLLTGIAMNKTSPYEAIITHGFTVDSKGHKMSKSLGNVISPEKIVNTLGADILRLWVASTNYQQEVHVSDEIVKRVAESYRRIRNTARFLLANIHDFDPKLHRVEPAQMLALDCFAIDTARRLQADIQQAYENYEYHTIYQKLLLFCSLDMGSFYLDIIKDRQYTTQTDSLARRSAQTAIYDIIETLTLCMAPILSFTAEEIWQHLPNRDCESVFLANWKDDLPSLSDNDVISRSDWEIIIQIRDALNKEIETKRNQGEIGSALSAKAHLYCSTSHQALLQKLKNELRFVFIVSETELSTYHQAPHYASATAVDELKLVVSASTHKKCVRCWHHQKEVGEHQAHPDLCPRCIDNVTGEGEQRHYA